ncbi:MAG TPA: hypothetical protein ENK91_00635 [Bacteroidetes bacterium]|nr:hypothetical protein [Bacteroidota bacterium]
MLPISIIAMLIIGMSAYFISCEKNENDPSISKLESRSVNSDINTSLVDQLLEQIDYSKLTLEDGILSIDADNNVILLDSAYNEYMKAIDQWYKEYKEQYLSDSPTDTTDIEVKMKDINWFYVSDVFSSHFPGFKSLQNRYKELESLWLQSNMDNDELDPWNIVVKDRLERMVLNSESEVIYNGEFIKVYDDGTNIKLNDFTKEDITLLKDKSNIELIAGKNRTAKIDYRSPCSYKEKNKHIHSYTLCDNNYRFIYEAGINNGYTNISGNYRSRYWGEANLYRRNIFGGNAWKVRADWMDVVLSGSVYLYPEGQIGYLGREFYPECTCELDVQTGIVSNCSNIENNYSDIWPFNNQGFWPSYNWKRHDTNCSSIQCMIGWLPMDGDNALKVSVDTYGQFCATFGFKHTRKKYKRKWPWSKKKLVCKDVKTKTGLTVCVK